MDKTYQRDRKLRIFLSVLALLAGIVISLFNHWEPGGETWGYWFFARIFAQTGRFIVPDRSPLYTIYLNLFRWLGYPNSVTAEYIVTSFITLLSLTVLCKKYLGLGLAVFASLIWLPFLQTAEPPVQKLALACSCLAIAARGANRGKFYFILSYALLGLAYLFRATYSLMIIIFVLWDIFKLIRSKGMGSLILLLRPRLIYWPVIIVIGLLPFFMIRQSPHPWNNTSVISAEWFPHKLKTLSEGGFIMNMNWLAIEDKYGSFAGKDCYFTNRAFFSGASTVPDMIKANPKLITKLLLRNIKNSLPIAVSSTDIFKIYSKLPLKGLFWVTFGYLLIILLFAGILNGAFRAAGKNESFILFVIANVALVFAMSLFLPKTRYTIPLIPVFILSAFWYGAKLRNGIIGLSRSLALVKIKRLLLFFSFFCIPAVIVVFSNGASNWLHLTTGLAGDLVQQKARVLEAPDYIKGSFTQIKQLTQNCKGVMALEHTFIGAFTDIPVDKIYDVWEIPPFGEFGNSVYNGLVPKRIDCLIISSELKTGVGFGTNYQIRYQNYIRPYAEKLKALGAKSYELGKFGEIVIL